MSGKKHIVFDHFEAMRLDRYLAGLGLASSRVQIHRWITQGLVSVNGKGAKPSVLLRRGDKIEVAPQGESVPSPLSAEPIPLDILYEDSSLLVLNKRAGQVVHPGAGHRQGTLVNGLIQHCGVLSTIGGVLRPGIVHRLDKGTSGVMVVAKNDATHVGLARQFQEHTVSKIYWALVYGCPRQEKGILASLIGRSPRHRKKFSVNGRRGKQAVTHYRMLQKGDGVSLVELDIKTGRTHQIRVHLTSLGHSVVGDPLYGGHQRRLKQITSEPLKTQIASLQHPLLHAQSLTFIHPKTAENMTFTAPLPEDFARVLQAL